MTKLCFRYISWPGQATSYKIGDRVIRKLRKAVEEKEGDKFDLKAFHERLLFCMGPLDTLRDCMKLDPEAAGQLY